MLRLHAALLIACVTSCSAPSPDATGSPARSQADSAKTGLETADAIAQGGGGGAVIASAAVGGAGAAAPNDESFREKLDDPFVVGCLFRYPNLTCTPDSNAFGGDLCAHDEPKQTLKERVVSDCTAQCCLDVTNKEYDCDAECKKLKQTSIGKCVDVLEECSDGKEATSTAVCRCYDAAPTQNPGPTSDYCKCPVTADDTREMVWDNCKTCAPGDDCFQQDCAIRGKSGGATWIFSCLHNGEAKPKPAGGL